MGEVHVHPPVKLISGIITADEQNFLKAHRILVRKFGPIDYKSPVCDFDFTNYYNKEMGEGLKRQFVSFARLIDPKSLPSVKLFTNKIERRNPRPDNKRSRSINLDPGYVTAAKLILATTKNYSHRIYLNKGIFAEITLYYKDGSFRAQDWAFPGYKTDLYIKIFNHIHDIYMQQRKGIKV